MGGSLPLFPRAGVAAGLSTHRRHQFLEADQVQHPFQIIHQRRQAPFALNFGEPFQQKVSITKPALDGSEGMLGQGLP